jgi:hypothetical protein
MDGKNRITSASGIRTRIAPITLGTSVGIRIFASLEIDTLPNGYAFSSTPAMDRLRRWKCKTIPASGWRQVRSESNRGAAGIELQRKRPTPSRHARCSRLQWVNFVSDFVGDHLGDPDAMVHRPNGELCNRTSFAPETASTKRNERDRNRTKT